MCRGYLPVLTGPLSRRTSTSCATARPWSTSAALTTMQRNYRPLSSATPAWGLRRGPSSSEPYRPSSSPPARMLLGPQHFRNIATPHREPRTALGEGAGQQAGTTALFLPSRPAPEPLRTLCSAAGSHASSHGVGGWERSLPFYTLSGVDRDYSLFPLTFLFANS